MATTMRDGNKPKRAKRKTGEIKDGPKLYFNDDTQAAIVAYQKSTEKKERDAIYLKEILPAFEKLTENLINIHKFSGLYDSYDDLKNDCVNFLFETIRKFNSERGTNAFSYFNVVAKNWLIIRVKQKSTKFKRVVSIEDTELFTNSELKVLEEKSIVQFKDNLTEDEFSLKNIKLILQDIKSKSKTDNEVLCINSIITIFENVDDIDFLNKSAVLLYIRELSGLTPKQLTTTMQLIKKNYRKFAKQLFIN